MVFFIILIAFPSLKTANADGTCSQTFSNTTAQICDFSQMQVSTQIKIKGQNGNFVAAGQDGSVTFEVVVTLVSPPTLTFGSTQVNVNTNKYYLLGAGTTVTPTDTSKYCGNPTIGTDGPTFTYFSCSNSSFDATSGSDLLGQTKKAGDILFDHTYTIDHTQFSNLGINKVVQGADTTTGINQVYVYTGLGVSTVANSILNSLLGSATSFYNTYTPGQSVYIQLYPTQAQADAAVSSGQTPPTCSTGQTSGCVPGYGTNVSTGGNPGAGPNPILNFINQVVGFILGLIQEEVYAIFSLLVLPLIEALLKIKPYTDAFVSVIYPGWIIVRNLCDILFILAIIIIAMATLFRVPSYQFRSLLVQLIIAALLINFSLVIGQSVLGLADTVQSQFLGNENNITQVRQLGQSLMTNSNSAIINYFNGTTNANAAVTNNTVFAGIVQSLFWLALSIGSLAVFAAICAYMFIRIVALWILLMISPIAYACGVLPSTAGYRSQWWQNFLKYAFFTPIMAFFLNLSAVMVYNTKNNPIFSQILNGTSPLTSGSGAAVNNLAALITSVGSDILLLIFLLASLRVAEQAGVIGAHGISGWAQKWTYAPFRTAAGGFKLAGGYLNRKKQEASANLADRGVIGKAAFAALNAGAVKEAFNKRSEQQKHDSEHYVQGKARNVVSGIFKEPITNQAGEALKHAVGLAAKELPSGSEEVALGTLKILAGKSKGLTQTEKGRLLAAMQVLIENKGTNAMLQRAKELHLSDQNYSTDDKGFAEFMNDFANKYKINKSDLAEIYTDWNRIWYNNNEFSYQEMIRLDHHGHPQLLTTHDKAGSESVKFINTNGELATENVAFQKGEIEGKAFYEKTSAANDAGFYYDEHGGVASLQAGMDEFENSNPNATDADKHTERARLRKKLELDQKRFFEHSEELGATYDNYARFVKAQGERANNLSKKGSQEKAREVHWNQAVVYDGEGTLQGFEGGLVKDFATFTRADVGQSDRMNNKRAMAMRAALNKPNGELELRDAIKRELESNSRSQLKEQGYSQEEINTYITDRQVDFNRVANLRLEMAKRYMNGQKFSDNEWDGRQPISYIDDPATGHTDTTPQNVKIEELLKIPNH